MILTPSGRGGYRISHCEKFDRRGAARGHYREPKLINPDKGMESARRAAHGHGGGSEPPKCGTRSVRRRSTEANDPSFVVVGLRPSSVALRRVERVEGNEGDSVGETPTGATGSPKASGRSHKGLGCNRLRAGLKTLWV